MTTAQTRAQLCDALTALDQQIDAAVVVIAEKELEAAKARVNAQKLLLTRDGVRRALAALVEGAQ